MIAGVIRLTFFPVEQRTVVLAAFREMFEGVLQRIDDRRDRRVTRIVFRQFLAVNPGDIDRVARRMTVGLRLGGRLTLEK